MKAFPGKKICIVVENLPVPFDRRVWQESRALAAEGAQVTVICPKTKAYPLAEEVIDGIQIYRHNLPEAKGSAGYLAEYGLALFHEFRLLCKVFWKHGRQNAIHACNPPDLIFLVAAPFKFLFRTKFLFDHHDINPELYFAKFGKKSGLFYKGLLWVERLTFALADHSIATNESYREIAITRGKMKPENVTVVRSGPDLSRLRIIPPVESYKKGRKFLVGYVGVMGAQEGIDLLLQAVDRIVKSGRTDVQFCLMGSGPSLQELRELCTQMGLADYVDFPGRVPDQFLLEAINTSDVCVNPDTPNEMNDKSTMNKIMEYMSLGKPIVQFDLKEGRFSAQDASLYANDVADFADKILWLLDNPKERERMGKFGRERVETTLSWEYEKKNLERAYRALLGV